MMVGAARRIGEAFVDMAAQAVQGVEQIAKAGIDFNAKMETYQTAFTTLMGDAQMATLALDQIRQDAASTPFDVDSLTQANQALLAAGVSAADARDDVLNLANAIAATGGGSAVLSRMAANMQQIKNTGKATAMDIRQFANAGINIYGVLADYLGVTAEEASQLDVTYEQLTGAFEHAAQAGGMYAGAMEAQSQTFNGRMATLKDNALQLAGVLTEDLFNTLSGDALPQVMDWVAQLLDAAQTGGIEGALEAAKNILGGLINSFFEQLPELANTGVELLVGLLDGLAGSGAVGQIMAGALSIIRALLGALAAHFPELLSAGISILMQIIGGLAEAIPALVMMAGELILQLFDAFIHADWASIGNNIVTGIQNGITGLWNSLLTDVQNKVSDLWGSVCNFLGIHSPSTKFKYIGEMSVAGTMEAFEDGQAELTRVVHDVYAGVDQAAQDALRPATIDVASRQDIERQVSVNMTATGSTGDMSIIVPLSVDGREIARATAWVMGEQLAWEEL
jgi:tape measure domain-containing protein